MNGKRILYGIGMVAAWLTAAFFVLVFIIGVAHPAKNGGAIPASIFELLVVALFGWLGLIAEHRFLGKHKHDRHATDLGGYTGPAVSGPYTSGMRTGRKPRSKTRKGGPVSQVVGLLIAAVILLGSPILTVDAFSRWLRSSETQHHGVLATGRAIHVHNFEHCSKGSCSWTAAVTVILSSPVNGTSFTVEHLRNEVIQSAPFATRVLVDPRDPAYSEAPGQWFTPALVWILPGLFTLFIDGGLLISLLKPVLKRRKAHVRAHHGSPSHHPPAAKLPPEQPRASGRSRGWDKLEPGRGGSRGFDD